MDKIFERELTALIPVMRAFARSLCHDATYGDDIAQEALAKAWANRASFTLGTNMKAWTFMIIRNQFYSDKRRSWRSCELDQGVAESTLMAVDDPEAMMSLDELRRAMSMLLPSYREALVLVGAAGLSYDEAAQVTGVAVGTVKSRVSRARDQLALIYAEGGIRKDGQSATLAMASLLTAATAVHTA